MNVITLTGNLGKDCESRFLPNGDPITSFSVADSQGRDKPSIWWDCTIFGKRAESLAPYLMKGQTVTVIGNITQREWTDKDGQKRKNMDIRVSDLALQGGRPAGGAAPVEGYQGGTGQRDKRGQRDTDSFPDPAPPPRGNPAPNFSDMNDDIPFILNLSGNDVSTVSKQLLRSKHDRANLIEF